MFKKRWVHKQKIRAVHDNEINGLLSSLGILDEVEKGEYRCARCGTFITIENLGAIYPEGETINFVCERLSCLGKVNLYRGGAND